MGDITANFSRNEFACKGVGCCGGSAPINIDLVKALQNLRDLAGVPLVISSGFRCNTHNRNVGGVSNSQHVTGFGVDVLIPEGFTIGKIEELARRVQSFKMGGIGLYSSWIHLDIRTNGPARWDKRT
jgi:uncharacterized protein YcbK (DUF882 family)